MIKPLARTIVLLLGLCVSTQTLAHGDIDNPLFVAHGGVDKGMCLDAAAPCGSIGYALRRVGKGGQIRVASGRFELTDIGDLFHLVSGLVDARGGFDSGKKFRQSATPTTLIGVPDEYRETLASRGFHIISDRKSLKESSVTATEQMLTLHRSLQKSMTSASCIGGMVNGLACNNTQLLSHVAFGDVSSSPVSASDVWGFVDLNTGREYAIAGYNNGTAVFDVSDATNPREVGFVAGNDTSWRDIKVYQYFNVSESRWNAYAYVTSDGSTDGLFVIDLTELPQRVSRQSYSSDFSAAHNLFALNTDFATGLSLTGAAPSLIIAGSDNGNGRFRLYSLASAASPSFVVLPEAASNDYMHDASSIIIRDSRKDSQCVNATDYCEVLFDFNETTVDIWDVTDTASPVRLSRTPYPNSGYTHSGWPSEDGQFLFVHDERDEQDFPMMQTTLRTFSLADLTAPALAGTWSGPTKSIDHNGFARGNRYYMSNYARGLTILDISNPASVQLAGMLDTYPFSDDASLVGAWGAYPFFPSGNIAVSDMSSGFYMVGDDTLNVAQGRISFTSKAFGGAEGDAIAVTVQRVGGSDGSVSAGLEMIPGTADASDILSQAGTLSWADGDASDKTVVFNTAVDANAEGLERMLLKLIAPSGGATLAPDSIASVYIGDSGNAAEVEFDATDVMVGENGFNTAVVVFQRSLSASGAVSVDYALSSATATAGSDYQGVTSGTINWADGDADPKWIEFLIVDDAQGEADEFFELSLTASSGASLGSRTISLITILDDDGDVDSDGDGDPDITDPDDDNDGVTDDLDAFPLDPTESIDTDNDGIGNNADPDDDDDGVTDDLDAFPLDPTESIDTDNDGIGNNADPDDDDDGISDELDSEPTIANNFCSGQDAAVFSEVLVDTLVACAATTSITVSPLAESSIDVSVSGDLQLLAPAVIFESGFTVFGTLSVTPADPCAGCL